MTSCWRGAEEAHGWIMPIARPNYLILGHTRRNGVRDKFGPRHLCIVQIGDLVLEYDREMDAMMTWEAPLVVDVDGAITRRGRWGFMPDAGQLEWLERAGIKFPQERG